MTEKIKMICIGCRWKGVRIYPGNLAPCPKCGNSLLPATPLWLDERLIRKASP